MRIATTLLSIALAIGATACKKDKKDPPAPSSGSSATAAGSADPTAADGAGSGSAVAPADPAAGSAGSADPAVADPAGAKEPEMARKAGKCPSTVFGAITTAELKGKDVTLTIASEDKDAVMTIQKRTELLLKEKQSAGGGAGAAHDQKGTHGGGQGLCPVFLGEGGEASSKQTPKGVVITITPKGSAEELKTIIDERISKSADWVNKNIKPASEGNTGGVGGGGGDHGSMHKGAGDSKGKERRDGTGGGAGTGGGGGAGTGGGGSKKDEPAKK